MKTRIIGHRLCSGLLVLGLAAIGEAQTSAPSAATSQAVRPVGVVMAIDPEGKRITLKTDAGPELAVLLQDRTNFLRVPPGERDLKNATKIRVSDIGVGDRILVRGRIAEDQKSISAASLIVMSKADIAKKHEADRAEWQRRGVAGTITTLNAAAREITISTRTPGDPKPMTILLPNAAVLRRYAPDSVKFSDAKPSTPAELRVGDEVRALGNKSDDGSRYTAEELVSGSFRNFAATVTSVDSTERTIKITDLSTQKPLLVRITADSNLRKLPPFVAQMMAMRMAPSATPSGRPGGESGIAVSGSRGMGSGGPGGGIRGPGGPTDISQMLERMPPVGLADLKRGDAIIVASTIGVDPKQVTAITVLAGVEPLLTAAPGGGQQMSLGPWNFEMNMNLP